MPDVLMPRLSDTMEEGTLSQWVKRQGEQVRRGDVLAVIETDKASMELEAYDEGVLTRVLVEEGETVPIGAPIAVISGGGTGSARPAAPQEAPAAGALSEQAPAEESWQAQAPAGQAPAGLSPAAQAAPSGQAPPGQAGQAATAVPAAAPSAEQPPGERVRTSPLARARARQHGIDLATIAGSGPGGRIVRADVDAAIARQQTGAGGPAAAPGPATAELPAAGAPLGRLTSSPVPPSPPARPAATAADDEDVPLSRVRRITAQRLAASAQEAPHFYLNTVVDAGPLLAFRAEVNDRPGAHAIRISVTDLLVRACAITLRAHPEANSSWAGDHLTRHRRVNVGVAVALDDGLIVPVVRDADRKTLTEIAVESKDLAQRARAGRLGLDEITGGTFTISNLGMYGIDHFTAVINPPEAAILAVGAARRQPVAAGDQIVIGTTMTLTLSIDHRVLDGATGAVFLASLKETLQDPLTIVV